MKSFMELVRPAWGRQMLWARIGQELGRIVGACHWSLQPLIAPALTGWRAGFPDSWPLTDPI